MHVTKFIAPFKNKASETFSDAKEFYPGVNTLISGTYYPTDAALNKLADDIRAQ